MTLRARNGHWHYRFTYLNQEYSGNTDLAATPQNKRAANAIETDALKALKIGRLPANKIERILFRDAVPHFLRSIEIRYRKHPSSFKRIKTSISSALVFMNNFPVFSIDAARIDEYKVWRVNTHEIRDITLRHDLHALSVFFQHAVRHHWAMTNPIREIEIPSDAEAVRMHILTTKEEEDYFQRAKRFPDLHDVCRLIINQGLRPEEATTLSKYGIDFNTGKIHIYSGKTAAAKRVLDMTAESREILKVRMKGPSQWIFPSSRKPGCHIGRINSAHDSIVREAALEGVNIVFVPYDLRHTFATQAAIEAGIDLSTLAALLGHSSTRCVHKYVHPTTEHKKNAMKRIERAAKEKKCKASPSQAA